MRYNIIGETTEKPKSSSIVIYPNPTFDTFEVTEDSNVKSIAIYNIIGKEVLTVSHTTGQFHDVSFLNEGIYLVRMLDATLSLIHI